MNRRWLHRLAPAALLALVLSVKAVFALDRVIRPNGSPRDYSPLLETTASPEPVSVLADSARIHGAIVDRIPPAIVAVPGNPSLLHRSPLWVPYFRPVPVFPPTPIRRIPINPPGGIARFLPSIDVNRCISISGPGRYVIQQNLTAEKTCISIINANNVVLDCQGHSIASTGQNQANIYVYNAQGLSISNCTATRPQEANGAGLIVYDSRYLVISRNTLDILAVFGSTATLVENNHLTGQYQQDWTSSTTFRDNTVQSYSDRGINGSVLSGHGTHNTFANNQIDGKWNSNPTSLQGADDGIVLYNEHDDRILNNTINNTWDCGIEPVGTLSNTTIQGNKIDNTGTSGIGEFWNTSWQNNIVSGNQVSNTKSFMEIFFTPTNMFGDPPPQTYYFKNNTIENNTFTSPSTGADYSIGISADPAIPGKYSLPAVAGNNVIADNHFPTNLLVMLTPPPGTPANVAFTDGGGNHCRPTAGSPITCLP